MRRLILSVMCALAACGGDSPTAPTQASVVGTWQLQSVNGQGLPYIAEQVGADKVELTSDVVTAAAGGSFAEIVSYRITQGGQVSAYSESYAGTYTLNGTAVTFRWNDDGSIGTGTVSGSTLTVAGNGLSLVFRKQ